MNLIAASRKLVVLMNQDNYQNTTTVRCDNDSLKLYVKGVLLCYSTLIVVRTMIFWILWYTYKLLNMNNLLNLKF